MPETEKIRVVIVDDISETRENIRKLLQFESDLEVVGVAQTGAEAIQVTSETRPDVVLMDINMPDMDGIAATEKIRAKLPSTQIVIFSVQSDPNYMRRAMLVGARDFLTKPPDVDELTAAIRRAGVMAQNEKLKEANTQAAVRAGHSSTSGRNYGDSGKIILVFSPKGGSGYTTLTTNLGVALHSEETPVVVVDGKLQFGDLSFFYNQQGPNNVTDLAPRGNELDHQVVEEVLVVHESSGVSILSAPPQLERSEEVSGVEFSQILKYLRRMFSYIIIDTGSNLDEVTLAGIDIADLIVLITTQDIPAIKNVRLFMNLTDLLGVDRNQILFLLNKFDKRRSINADRIGDITKQTVMGTIPVDEKFVIPAMDRGIPFIIENPSNSVSKAVFKFAEVLKERIAENDQVEEFELEN